MIPLAPIIPYIALNTLFFLCFWSAQETLISLKDYAARLSRQNDLSVLSYVCNRVNEKTNGNLTLFELRELLSGYSWIFFFDGLDEVPASSNRGEVLSRIQSFLSQDLSDAQCDNVVVCTSRPQGYNGAFSANDYRHYQLEDLSPERCKEYMEKLLTHIEKNGDMQEQYRGVLYHALETPLTAKLMTTPLYTSIIVVMVKLGGTPPTKRYDLFHDYCEIISKRELEKRTLPQVGDAYDWIIPLHARIGFLLQAESETKENAAAELIVIRCKEIILKYLVSEEYNQKDALPLSEKLYSAMITRLPFLEEISKEQEDIVHFPLRSIQEYFAAEWIISSHDDKTEELRETLERISVSAYWRNVYLFVAGFFAQNPSRATVNHELYRICLCGNVVEDFEYECASQEVYQAALSGSYLALDMLNDNLFRKQKEQEKYLTETVKPFSELITDADLYTQIPEKCKQSFLKSQVIPAVQADLNADSAAFHCLWCLAASGNTYAKEQLEERIDQISPPENPYFFAHSWDYNNLGDQTIRALFRWWKPLCYGRETNDEYFEFFSHYLERFPEAQNGPAYPGVTRGILYRLLLNGDSLSAKLAPIFDYFSDLSALSKASKNLSFSYQSNAIYDNKSMGFHPVFAPISEIKEREELAKVFASSGLPELAALTNFLIAPSQQTLAQLLFAYQDLPIEDQSLFRNLIRNNNWLLSEISHRLEAERVEDVKAYYDDSHFVF